MGDCVLKTTLIINRLLTPVLKNRNPCEVLFRKKPSYDHLEIFGCLAFAYNPWRTIDKFKPRGVPSVFLGYSNSQKGYGLLKYVHQEMHCSRDVKFMKGVFPFH